MKRIVGDWYDFPELYDIAFQGDTALEADFIEAAAKRFLSGKMRKIFEPGCGTARLLVELARRGYTGVGLDRNTKAVEFARNRLAAEKLTRKVRIDVGDMTQFDGAGSFDLAFSFYNTFRALLAESAARSHLESVAAALRPGGLFLLGLHLLPPDAEFESFERWTEERNGVKVTVTLKVVDVDPIKRVETLRFSLRVRDAERDWQIRSEEKMRFYSAAQFKRLLGSVKAFELVSVHDFWFDIDYTAKLNDDIADTVVVLRRR